MKKILIALFCAFAGISLNSKASSTEIQSISTGEWFELGYITDVIDKDGRHYQGVYCFILYSRIEGETTFYQLRHISNVVDLDGERLIYKYAVGKNPDFKNPNSKFKDYFYRAGEFYFNI